jgi:hypothetical protein
VRVGNNANGFRRKINDWASSDITDFVIYNNYKNNIINNKSDKSKILNLRMAARHCQWRRANASLSVASLYKCATAIDIFIKTRHCQ